MGRPRRPVAWPFRLRSAVSGWSARRLRLGERTSWPCRSARHCPSRWSRPQRPWEATRRLERSRHRAGDPGRRRRRHRGGGPGRRGSQRPGTVGLGRAGPGHRPLPVPVWMALGHSRPHGGRQGGASSPPDPLGGGGRPGGGQHRGGPPGGASHDQPSSPHAAGGGQAPPALGGGGRAGHGHSAGAPARGPTTRHRLMRGRQAAGPSGER